MKNGIVLPAVLTLAITLTSANASACASRGPTKLSKAEVKATRERLAKERNKRTKRKLAQSDQAGPMPVLPETHSRLPWGGQDVGRQRSEALIANSASRALNEAWKIPNVVDVIVSMPVKMRFSNERPYGDGQTNASASLGDWTFASTPLVASLIRYKSDPPTLNLRVAKNLINEVRELEITFFVDSSSKPGKPIKKTDTITLSSDPTDPESLVGKWTVPAEKKWGDLFSSRVAFLRPKGWKDSLPIDFRHPVVTTDELIRAGGHQKLSGGRSLLDPENILKAAKDKAQSPFEVLLNKSESRTMGTGFNQDPYEPKNVHAWFPENNAVSFTAVGKGWTWVVGDNGDRTNSPLKNLYTCFERRQPENEAERLGTVVSEAMNDPAQAQSRNGRTLVAEKRVTSGGGWHEIGDFAETIINNLESEPIVVGMATGLPWPSPPSGGFAFSLSDVATVRWLKPGEAMITPAGDQTLKEKRQGIDPKVSGGRNYHWFFFHHDREVCTQELVHNCVPKPENSLGLQCN